MTHTLKHLHFAALFALCFSLMACTNSEKEQCEVYNTVRDVNELQLASATVTKIYTVRDPYYDDKEQTPAKLDLIDRLQRTLHVMEHSMIVGDRIGIYGLQCTYAAVMDLNKLSPDDIKVERIKGVKQVTIALPPVQVQAMGNDFETKVYHERYSGLRSAITEEERTMMRRKASDELNAEFSKRRSQDIASLRKTGEDKAIDFFTTMLQNLGYMPKVTIKN